MRRSNEALYTPARSSTVVARVQQCVREALGGGAGGYVLAVSGGADSMVLLHAASATVDHDRLLVATFDHGTGPAAAKAATFVVGYTSELGLRVVRGAAPTTRLAPAGEWRHTEAHWRRMRLGFLTGVAQNAQSAIVTAHTRDDQVETVFMRALRDAGPRGLAALYASSAIIRPLLRVSRADILKYAQACGITFITDPSNSSRKHLRNRVRHDLLPAIRARSPDFESQLLDLAARAADWRTQMDRVAATFKMMSDTTGSFYIPLDQFAGYSAEALRVLWPSLAARAGVVMDRRGTHRLAEFTIEGEVGQTIQLSGGVEVRRRRDALVMRRWRAHD